MDQLRFSRKGPDQSFQSFPQDQAQNLTLSNSSLPRSRRGLTGRLRSLRVLFKLAKSEFDVVRKWRQKTEDQIKRTGQDRSCRNCLAKTRSGSPACTKSPPSESQGPNALYEHERGDFLHFLDISFGKASYDGQTEIHPSGHAKSEFNWVIIRRIRWCPNEDKRSK